MVRVFVSYSHESPEHTQRVRELTERLRRDGFDARLDQYEIRPPLCGWPAWCSRQIVKAKFVLMICTQAYFDRFLDLDKTSERRGVKWEGRVIQNLLYFDYLSVGFLPVLFSKQDVRFIPPPVSGCDTIILQNESSSDEGGYANLLTKMGHDARWQAQPVQTVPVTSDLDSQMPDGISIPTDEVWNLVEQKLKNIADSLAGRFAPPLLTPQARNKPKSGLNAGITDLRYDKQWLDFRRRPHEEFLLKSFIEDAAIFSWWGIVGEGGIGKTREAFELGLSLSAQGWDTGFLRGDDAFQWLKHDCRGWRPKGPTLIVIDYAAQRAAALLDGLYNLSDSFGRIDGATPKVRLLLLDRPGRVYPSSSELIRYRSHDTEVRDRVRDFLYKPSEQALKIEKPGCELKSEFLEGVYGTPAEPPLVREHELLSFGPFRRDEWRSVLAEAIAQAGGDPSLLPDLNDEGWWERVGRLTGNGRLLFLQILGVCLARDQTLVSGLSGENGLTELLDAMLAHESDRRWPDLFPNELGNSREAIRRTSAYEHVLRGAAFVTLTRGIELPLHGEQLLQAAGGSAEHLNSVLPRLLPGNVQFDESNKPRIHLPPLEPDLIGERLLLRLTHREHDINDPLGLVPRSPRIEIEAWIRNGMIANPFGILQTLLLLAQDFPSEGATQIWISELMSWLESHELPNSEPAQAMAARMVSSIFIFLAKSNAGDSSLQSERLLKFVNRTEICWKSAFVQFVRAVTQKSTCAPASPRIDRMLIEFAQSKMIVEAAEETQLLLSIGAFNVLTYYGGNHEWEGLERWGKVLIKQSNVFPEHLEIQQTLSEGAFNAINYYCEAKNWTALEHWGNTLINLGTSYPEQEEIQFALTKGAFNAINAYGKVQNWDSLERWGGILLELKNKYSRQEEIQLATSNCALNVAHYYGEKELRAPMESWNRVLLEQSERYPSNEGIQSALSRGAANAINHYGKVRNWNALEKWGKTLHNHSHQFPDHEIIQYALSKGALNAVSHYSDVNDLVGLERWASVLVDQSSRIPEQADIQLALTQGAFIAFTTYGKIKRWETLERWGKILVEQCARYRDHLEIQLELSKAVVCAISYYGAVQGWEALERWGSVIIALGNEFPKNAEIHMAIAQSAVNAIHSYGTAQKWESVERWGTALSFQSDSFRDHTGIRLTLCQGAVNAIHDYGYAQNWEELEKWGHVLIVEGERFAKNEQIQWELVKGAINAIVHYCHSSITEAMERWMVVVRKTLPMAAFTAEEFLQMLLNGIVLTTAAQNPVAATELCLILLEYWPGFTIQMDDQKLRSPRLLSTN